MRVDSMTVEELRKPAEGAWGGDERMPPQPLYSNN